MKITVKVIVNLPYERFNMEDEEKDPDFDEKFPGYFDSEYLNQGIIEDLVRTYSPDGLTYTKILYFTSSENFAKYWSDKMTNTTYKTEYEMAKYYNKNNIKITTIVTYNDTDD